MAPSTAADNCPRPPAAACPGDGEGILHHIFDLARIARPADRPCRCLEGGEEIDERAAFESVRHALVGSRPERLELGVPHMEPVHRHIGGNAGLPRVEPLDQLHRQRRFAHARAAGEAKRNPPGPLQQAFAPRRRGDRARLRGSGKRVCCSDSFMALLSMPNSPDRMPLPLHPTIADWFARKGWAPRAHQLDVLAQLAARCLGAADRPDRRRQDPCRLPADA